VAQGTDQISQLLDRGSYVAAEELARARIDALTADGGAEPLEHATATDLLVRALVLNGKATVADTPSLADEALRRRQAVLGPEHPDLIPSLINLSDVLLATGEPTRAVDVARRAVALGERGAEASDMRPAQALDRLGSALTGAGRYDDAVVALTRSLRIKEAALPPSSTEIARTLESLTWTLQRKGDYDGAGPIIRRALAIQEAAQTAHPAYAEVLTLFGLQLWFEGNLPEAREVSTRAVAAAELTLRPDHPTLARALRYQAGAVMDLGDLSQGRVLLERALGIAERTFGPRHYDTGAYLNDLAIAEYFLGNYTSARSLLERALQVTEARVGRWHDRVATQVNNLALIDTRLGDYASAQREHARAMAIWERVFDRNHPFVAKALVDLAAAYRDQGSPKEALPRLERALQIRERRLGPQHRDVATTLADLATTQKQLGQSTRAAATAARALRIWEQAAAPEAPEFAAVLALYADLQHDLGHAEDARQSYERALTIQAKVLGRSHPSFVGTQAGLASTLAEMGDRPSAMREAVEAESNGRDHLRLMLKYLPERQSLAYAASRPRGLDLILSLATSVPDAPEAALDAVIRSRALVLDEMAARRGEVMRADADVVRLRTDVVSAKQRLANLIVRGPGDLDPQKYATVVDQARREGEIAERRLAERSAAFRAEQTLSQIGLNEVRASLPPGTVLLSFVRYERASWNESITPLRPSPPGRPVASYLAFILRSDRPPVAVRLATAATLDRLVTEWRQDIATEITVGQTPSVSGRRTSMDSGRALRKLVWDPIASHVEAANRILVVPDGALHLLPFVALPGAGNNAYLLEESAAIHYLSTERDVVTPPLRTTSTARGLLAVGAPAFDRVVPTTQQTRPRASGSAAAAKSAAKRGIEPGCGAFQSTTFNPLAGTLQEVRDIAALWQDGRQVSPDDSAQVIVGPEATERAFKQNAPGHRVLHLATHGFFLGSDCAPATPGRRGIGGLAPASAPRPASSRAENPLLLSGLALAGANQRAAARPQDDDGILTAEEVVSLNLEGVEWAVLSACETGVGAVQAGEGVFGLRRAFQVAGARTVIMSLWSVDDQAALAWMRALYQGRLQRDLSTADAARSASLTVLRSRRAAGQSTSPFYWAAFVAVGDPR
jgi:CHAT domain-containing protein/tetratricopeptide (TPR) repeat protein